MAGDDDNRKKEEEGKKFALEVINILIEGGAVKVAGELKIIGDAGQVTDIVRTEINPLGKQVSKVERVN